MTAQTGFVIIGRNADGDVVATQAARFFDWSGTTLHDEAVSLRMLYADADAARARGDRCEIKNSGRQRNFGTRRVLRCRLVPTGFPEKRTGFDPSRISRTFAFTRWQTGHTISIMADAVVTGGFADRTGYTKVASGAADLVVTPMGVLRGAFVWMDTAELLSDLEQLMAAANQAVSDQPADRSGVAVNR